MQKLKKVLAVVLTVAMVLTGTVMPVFATTAAFDDTKDHWAEEAVERWANADILKGNGDGNFRPNDNMTRAELATVAFTLLGLDTKDTYTKSFTDVKADAWYADEVLACADAGIINGMGDGTFKPNDPITREQAFTIITLALKLKAAPQYDLTAFLDGDKVSSWAVPYVKSLMDCKAVHGYAVAGGFELRPQNPITRAEVAKILDYLVTVYVTADGTVSPSSSMVIETDKGNQVVVNQVVVSGQNAKEVTVKVEEKVENGVVVGTEIVVQVGNEPPKEIVTENTDTVPGLIIGGADEAVEVTPGTDAVVPPADPDTGCKHVVNTYPCTNCAVNYVSKEVVCLNGCDSEEVVKTVEYAHGHDMVNGVCEHCNMTLDAAMKFHAYVTSDTQEDVEKGTANGVDVLVTNDYAATITVDPSEVIANDILIGVEMQNVGSLDVNGVKKHSQRFETGIDATPELSFWLGNVFDFGSGKVNANINGAEVSYDLVGLERASEDANKVITATPSGANGVNDARAAWAELTKHVTTDEQAASDSKIVIKNGSYMVVGDDKLCFEKGEKVGDIVLDGFADDVAGLEEQIRDKVQLLTAPASEYEAQFFLAAGTQLAVSNSIATLDYDCLIAVDADALKNVAGYNDILNELQAANDGYTMAQKVVTLLDSIVAAADAEKNDNNAIKVDITFTKPVEKNTKFYLGVTANNANDSDKTTVDLEVFDDYSLEINLPMNEISAEKVTLDVAMNNVGSLGVNGSKSHSQIVNTGMKATGDLGYWVKAAKAFTNATINVDVEGVKCTYELVGDLDQDWVTITGTTDTEAARLVWQKLVNGNVDTDANQTEDSYINIANGSYVDTTFEKLAFTNKEVGDLKLNNFSDLGALKQTIKDAVVLVKGEANVLTLHVAAGTELAVSGSKATLVNDCTIKVTGLTLPADVLTKIQGAADDNEALVKEVFNVLNTLIENAKGKTIDVEVTFDKPQAN